MRIEIRNPKKLFCSNKFYSSAISEEELDREELVSEFINFVFDHKTNTIITIDYYGSDCLYSFNYTSHTKNNKDFIQHYGAVQLTKDGKRISRLMMNNRSYGPKLLPYDKYVTTQYLVDDYGNIEVPDDSESGVAYKECVSEFNKMLDDDED